MSARNAGYLEFKADAQLTERQCGFSWFISFVTGFVEPLGPDGRLEIIVIVKMCKGRSTNPLLLYVSER